MKMINTIYKNKSGGFIKIVGITVLDYRAQYLDYRAQYLDDDSVEFSITPTNLSRYWIEQGFTRHTTPLT